MDYTVIRYRVKETSVDENRALIRKVFEELEQVVPRGFGYLVLETEDGEFMHIVGVSDRSDASPLQGLAAFRAFTENHGERRSTPVVRSAARIIGNFRSLAVEPAGGQEVLEAQGTK